MIVAGGALLRRVASAPAHGADIIMVMCVDDAGGELEGGEGGTRVNNRGELSSRVRQQRDVCGEGGTRVCKPVYSQCPLQMPSVNMQQYTLRLTK